MDIPSPYYGAIDGRCRCCCGCQDKKQQAACANAADAAADNENINNNNNNNAQRRRRFLLAVQQRKNMLTGNTKTHKHKREGGEGDDFSSCTSDEDGEDNQANKILLGKYCRCTSSVCSCGSDCSCCGGSSTPAEEGRSPDETLQLLMKSQQQSKSKLTNATKTHKHKREGEEGEEEGEDSSSSSSTSSDGEDKKNKKRVKKNCRCTSSNCSCLPGCGCGSDCSCCGPLDAGAGRSPDETLQLLMKSQVESRRRRWRKLQQQTRRHHRRAPQEQKRKTTTRTQAGAAAAATSHTNNNNNSNSNNNNSNNNAGNKKFMSSNKTEMLLSFYVGGMTCDGCAAALADRLHLVPGIMEATVSFAARRADVWVHTEQPAAMLECLQVVEELGYRVLQHAPVPAAAATTTTTTTDNNNNEATPTPTTTTTAVAVAPAIHKLTLLIEGMSCASCAARIETHLLTLPEVSGAVVSFSTCMATVRTREVGTVLAAIRGLGYEVRDITPTSTTSKKTQPNKEATTTAAAATPGVATIIEVGAPAEAEEEREEDMTVTERTRSALERTQEIRIQRRLCIGSLLLSLPLAASMLLMSTTSVMHTYPRFTFYLDLLQCVCATIMVVFFGKQFYVGAWRSFRHKTFTMDTLIAIGTGCAYSYSLVSFVMAVQAYLSSTTSMYHPGDYYFDTAGMLLAFMLLGRFLEANAKRQTSSALIALLQLVPPTALVVQEEEDNENENNNNASQEEADDALLRRLATLPLVQMPSAEVRVGMRVMVRAGDRIPVDGTVVSGSSDVDEQMVTGESVPKWVQAGGRVVGGTTNLTATLLVRADRVGEATMLAQVLRLVQDAQNTKPAVQRVADRVAMYFVPCVVLFSLLTLAAWLLLGYLQVYPASWRGSESVVTFALNFFIATVVAACPCALGLATPTAIMVGTGVGAQHGVLVKSGATLETVRRINCVVFDKTGTLTTGKLACARQVVYHELLPEGVNADLARACVLAVEGQSNHPIALAVTSTLKHHLQRKAEQEQQTTPPPPPLVVRSAVTHSGLGVEAVVSPAHNNNNNSDVRWRVLVGSLTLLEQRGISVPETVALEVLQQQAHGRTTVVAAILPETNNVNNNENNDKGSVCFLAALADGPKPEAAAVVAALQRRGIRTLMVTGDHRSVAGRVAREVGISLEDVHAEALPTTKAAIVKQLQSSAENNGAGYRVLVAGDGINDSPALVQADAGVALGAGTEVAMEAADAVLVRNSLIDLLTLLALSRTTVHRIYGNFVWALGYNALMLPLASGMLFPLLQVQLPPVVAGLAMMLSSLSVLLSSLSLRCFRPYKMDSETGEVYQ